MSATYTNATYSCVHVNKGKGLSSMAGLVWSNSRSSNITNKTCSQDNAEFVAYHSEKHTTPKELWFYLAMG